MVKLAKNDYRYAINNKKKMTGQMKGILTELILHLVIQANTAKEAVDLNLQQKYHMVLCREENASVKSS